MRTRAAIVGIVSGLLFAMSASADNGLLPGEIDLGLKDGYTGYTSSDLEEPGFKKVRTYDYLCPGESFRPPNGVVEITIPAGKCLSKYTGGMVDTVDSSSECFGNELNQAMKPLEDGYQVLTFTLGMFQCFSGPDMRIVEMDRVYRDAYHIVSFETKGIQESFSHGSKKAAQVVGKTSGGIFSSCTPNPFALCSGGKPDKDSGLRPCWNLLC